MKKFVFFLIACLIYQIGTAEAADQQCSYAKISGYANGLGDYFISRLAFKQSDRTKENWIACQSSWSFSRSLGYKHKELPSKKDIPANEQSMSIQYDLFVSMIDKSILNNAGFREAK